jgi:hypothetical protein
METLTIEFQPNLKSKIIDLLSTFSEDEVNSSIEINSLFDPNFDENKKMLDKLYERFKSGKAKTYTIGEVDLILDKKFADYDS